MVIDTRDETKRVEKKKRKKTTYIIADQHASCTGEEG